MRTGIYVYRKKTSFELTPGFDMFQFVEPDGETDVEIGDDGTVVLAKGIYKVVSKKSPAVRATGASGDADIIVVINDKDPWPDPPAKFSQAFSQVAPATLKRFFPQSAGGFNKQPRAAKILKRPKRVATK